MQSWRVDNAVEAQLLEALTGERAADAASIVQAADLALPVTAAAYADEEAPAWPTMIAGGQTWVVAYTSSESMRAGIGGAFEHARVCSLAELAAGWPDPQWGLVLNPGLPVEIAMAASQLARLAAPSLLEDRKLEPAARTPLMQKLLRHTELAEMLRLGITRVSGYCHQSVDVGHIATPAVLIDAVGRKIESDELMTGNGSVNILIWPAVGLELYRNAYGGVDEASRAAVEGWLIEEPPFRGLGFAPNIDETIRDYKVDGVGLPHGAEIYELTDAGELELRASLDADTEEWMLLVDVDADAAGVDPTGNAPSGDGAASDDADGAGRDERDGA
jgi:hypothetical protein